MLLDFSSSQACSFVWGFSSVGGALDWDAAEAGLVPHCGKGFFSRSPLSVQTLSRCLYTPCVQSHALTSVCAL